MTTNDKNKCMMIVNAIKQLNNKRRKNLKSEIKYFSASLVKYADRRPDKIESIMKMLNSLSDLIDMTIDEIKQKETA